MLHSTHLLLMIALTTCTAAQAWAGGVACCFPDGTCLDLPNDDCEPMGGECIGCLSNRTCDEFIGTPMECMPSTGACCDEMLMCTEVEGAANCPAPSTYIGDGTTCDPGICIEVPPEGACCDPNKGCFQTIESECGSTWLEDTPCDPGVCDDVIPGACCTDVGPITQCADTVSGDCVNGNQTFFANDVCANDPCGILSEGACCTDTGEDITCSIATETGCQLPGQTYQGDDTLCCPNPCEVEEMGACCTTGGGCALTFACECNGQDQNFIGVGTTCTPDPCAGVTGACCTGDGQSTSCEETAPDGCFGDGQVFAGDGTACVDDPCPGIFCSTTADCADLDLDGIRDNNCLWWECTLVGCLATDVVFADMGGQFGACEPDGTADGNDRFQALNCFSATGPGGGAYACEAAPPAALNVDAGGQFGSCASDGVCDGNDAFAALNAFGGETTCSCPLDGGAAPTGGAAVITEHARLRFSASATELSPGQMVEIAVWLTSPLQDLRGYQLHVESSGGTRGRLELVDIWIDPPESKSKRRGQPTRHRHIESAHVFDGLPYWEAYNITTRQMVVGLDTAGVGVQPGYLATFAFRAGSTARGTFAIELLAFDEAAPGQRSFLFPTRSNGAIGIDRVPALTVVVD